MHQLDDIEPEVSEAPDDPAAERARRYLDLWERNLAHLALHGPAPLPAVPRSGLERRPR